VRPKFLSFESWRFWWAYNNDGIGGRASLRTPLDPRARAALLSPLLRSLGRPDDHEDIHAGALVALGRIGAVEHAPLFRDAALDELRGRGGRRIHLGLQASEAGVLALGLLPVSAGGGEFIDGALAEIVGSERLRSRERVWGAVGLGLRRDRQAIKTLRRLLAMEPGNEDLTAGLLCGLGLIGDPAVVPDLNAAFESGVLCGRQTSDTVRAFVGYAIAKLADARSLAAAARVTATSAAGPLARRSAVIALGTCCATASDSQRAEAVHALERFVAAGPGDPSERHFAIIALGRIGTEPALRHLIALTRDGVGCQPEFACLGLATHVFDADRRGGMDPKLREEIVAALREGTLVHKAPEPRAAFLLGLGLVKHRDSVAELAVAATKGGTDPLLRGGACVALGLIGEASPRVMEALTLALRETSSVDLRIDAATAIGMLRDASALPMLLDMFGRTRAFSVQAAIVRAIGMIGDASAIAPLAAVLDDTAASEQSRALAAAGLGLLGDPGPTPALGRVAKDYNYRASVPDLDELLFTL